MRRRPSTALAWVSGAKMKSKCIEKGATYGFGGGARFETPTAPETIGRDLVSSVQSQLLTEKSEVEEELVKHDWTG